MLASSGSSSNPFAEMYAAISGRGESASTNIQVYFPYAKQPQGKAMDLNVRRDSTVEEAIGFALWSYWEAGWLPKLDEGLTGEDDPRWATRLSAVGWILRIAEDDGEVDDDFPREFPTAHNSDSMIISFIQHRIVWERSPNSIRKVMLFWKPRLLRVGS